MTEAEHLAKLLLLWRHIRSPCAVGFAEGVFLLLVLALSQAAHARAAARWHHAGTVNYVLLLSEQSSTRSGTA
jgi:hypothetical protein